MAKWFHPDLLDLGLDRVRNRIAAANDVRLHVLATYTAGQAWATVLGNSIGNTALAEGDLTLGDQGTNGRQVAVGAKSMTAGENSGAAPDLHIAILNHTDSKVMVVTDETTDQVVTQGNPINVPGWAFKQNQPV